VFVFDGDAIGEMIVQEDVLVSNFVDSLAIDAAGMLWVGTDGGIQVLDPADPTQPWQLFEDGEQGPGGNWARNLFPQPDGSMWVAITNGEASYYDGQAWTVYEGYYSYEAIAVDAEGRVWLGDDGKGIAILEGGSASTLTSADGLPDDDVYALLADGDVMWIGTGAGLVRYQDSELTLVFGEKQASEELGLYNPTILDIVREASGDLLLGTYGGVLRYDGAQATLLLKFGDLGADFTYASFKEMALGPDGQLWVGTTEGLLYSDDGQNWDWFDTRSGLQTDDVDAVLVDQFGTLWVGGGDNFGGGGLSRYVP
jgi:ligand-binding sensor domain-containing protein